jgi:hypothetical protein
VSIGAIPFEEGTAKYTFRDETLMSALTAANLDGSKQEPQVLYCVTRAAAQQLWGVSNTTAATQTVMPLSLLHLLRVSDYQTAWADQTARTVKVTWQYADEAAAVWDSRAKMNIVVSATNREGNGAGTYLVPLTEADMLAREKVITLDRSCVDYKITFDVKRGESAIPVEPSTYFEIRTAEDWTAFCRKVKDAGGKTNVNATLLADIAVGEMAGIDSSKPFRGVFEGNGHTLTVNVLGNERYTGIFRYVGNATFRNLNIAGTVQSNSMYATGLVADIIDQSSVIIENCRSSVNLVCTGSGDMTMSGFVGRLGNANLTIRNCRFDGSFKGADSYGHAGFVSWEAPNSNVIVENCLFAPISIDTKCDSCDTWVRKDGKSSAVVSVTNSYCTKEYHKDAEQYANYFVINNDTDYETFLRLVEAAAGKSDVNAVLNADVNVTRAIGITYRGIFDGNSHTLNLNLKENDAPFYNVGNATFKNLNAKDIDALRKDENADNDTDVVKCRS